MQTRPTSLNVFGILNISFAVMGVFGILFSAVLLALCDHPLFKDNLTFKLVRDFPGYRMLMKYSIVLGIPSLLMLAISGIGLLKLKPWARMLSIIYGIFAVLQCLGLIVAYYFTLIVPILNKHVDFRDPQTVGAFSGALAGIVGSCINIIYPVVLIIFMNRRNVVDALRPGPKGVPPPMPFG